MLFGRTIMFFMALLLAMVFPLQAGPPKGQPVNPLKQWSGSVDDLFLMKGMPKFIISAEELEKLWQAWKVSGPVPQVDFSKELVLVATSRGSILHLSPTLDDKGDLTDVGIATMDLLPGFRYVIAVVSRERVKTVNGKELTAKAEQSHPKTNSAPELADFGVSGVEVQSVKTMDIVQGSTKEGLGKNKSEGLNGSFLGADTDLCIPRHFRLLPIQPCP